MACSLVGVIARCTCVPIGHIESTGVTHVPIVVVLDLVGVRGPVAVVRVGITSTERWKTACICLTLRGGKRGWGCSLAWLLVSAGVTVVASIAPRIGSAT